MPLPSRHCLAVTVIPTALVIVSQLGDAAEVPSADNLALRKTYELNQQPSSRWYNAYFKKLGLKPPDPYTVLTDGVFCPTQAFHVSDKAINFEKIFPVEITVDLGAVHPIAEIYNHHNGHIYLKCEGIPLPSREEYYVSEDGEAFYKVGTHVRKKDRCFRGIERFTSGPIRTKGRYVLLRTFPQPGMAQYAGFDEIVVRPGDFGLETVALTGEVFMRTSSRFDREVFGFRISPPDWRKRRAHPVNVYLDPHGPFGDDTFYVSTGDVYDLRFRGLHTGEPKVKDVVLHVRLPGTVEVVDHSGQYPLQRSALGPGEAGSLTMKLDDRWLRGGLWSPFLAVSTRESGPKLLGEVLFWLTYTHEGRQRKTKPWRVRLQVIEEVLRAPQPGRFTTAFWVPRHFRHATDLASTAARLAASLKRMGFTWVTGQAGAEIRQACDRNGLAAVSSGLCPNGYEFAKWDRTFREKFPADYAFVYHPKGDGGWTRGVCPTVLISDAFFPLIVERCRDQLTTVGTHVENNWEPHGYLKQGCVCARCRRAFQEFAKLSPAKLDALWPDVVLDRKHEAHNAFTSFQQGRAMVRMQEGLDRAARELGLDYAPLFLPQVAPRLFFDPKNARYPVHQPQYFLPRMRAIMLWAYPYCVDMMAFNPKRVASGANLKMTGNFQCALAARKKHGRTGEKGLPSPLFVNLISGLQLSGRLMALPDDFAFQVLLTFAWGLEGYSSYTPLSDARYMRLIARAHRVIAAWEDVVLDGQPLGGVRAEAVSPHPGPRDPVCVRGYARGDRRVVAIGNDYVDRTYARLRVPGLPAGRRYALVDGEDKVVFAPRAGQGYSAAELARGVLVPLERKSWRFLELAAPAGRTGGDWRVLRSSAVTTALKREREKLQTFADRFAP